MLLMTVLAIFLLGAMLVQAQRPIVFVVPVEGMIDLGLAPFIQRVLDEADQEGAQAVVLEVNTFGGRVDAAVLIRDALLENHSGCHPIEAAKIH